MRLDCDLGIARRCRKEGIRDDDEGQDDCEDADDGAEGVAGSEANEWDDRDEDEAWDGER